MRGEPDPADEEGCNARSTSTRQVLTILGLSMASLVATTVASPNAGASPHDDRQRPAPTFELLGAVTFPTGTTFGDTEVGGLSAITYDARHDRYFALSDDRVPPGGVDPDKASRYYTLDIDLDDGRLDDGDVTLEDVTFLRASTGQLVDPAATDPEGIALRTPGQLYISSEGSAGSPQADPIDPFVNRYNTGGRQTRALSIPAQFLPDGTGMFGVRENLGFESLTVSPRRRLITTVTENALAQDGPVATQTTPSASRLLRYSARNGRPKGQYVYPVSAVPPTEGQPLLATNGISDLVALDERGSYLALERAVVVRLPGPQLTFTVRLYETSIAEATNVARFDTLPDHYRPMEKRLALDVADLGVVPDNLEGATLGPKLPDGRQVLLLVSDNNFLPVQATQFVALAVDLRGRC